MKVQCLASEIHDDAVQVLDAVALRLEQAGARLSETADAEHVEQLGDEVRAAAERLRLLLLRLAEDDGGEEADGELHRALAQEGERLATHDKLEFELIDRLRREPAQAESLRRIARELLTNVRKHAAARRVRTTLAPDGGGVRLQVEDDGVGFAPQAQRPGSHAGLRLVEQQVRQAGGRWSVTVRPSGGTAVEVWLPER